MVSSLLSSMHDNGVEDDDNETQPGEAELLNKSSKGSPAGTTGPEHYSAAHRMCH